MLIDSTSLLNGIEEAFSCGGSIIHKESGSRVLKLAG
jgi:hypothetical protein